LTENELKNFGVIAIWDQLQKTNPIKRVPSLTLPAVSSSSSSPSVVPSEMNSQVCNVAFLDLIAYD
jgi:hypothetical protein